jgi:hypothetical protein
MHMGKGQFSKENQSVPFDKGTRGRCYRDTGKVKGREMRDTNTIVGLIQERGRKGLPLERVYKLLFNLSSQESPAFTPGEEWRVLLESLGWRGEIHSQILALKNPVSHSTLVL